MHLLGRGFPCTFIKMHSPGVKFSRTLRNDNALLVIAKRKKDWDNGGRRGGKKKVLRGVIG